MSDDGIMNAIFWAGGGAITVNTLTIDKNIVSRQINDLAVLTSEIFSKGNT